MASPIETVAEVAAAFVEFYYLILSQTPQELHKFYHDSSLVSWQQNDDLVAPATTLSGINEKIMSSDFKDGKVEILTQDAQESVAGAIFIVVFGLWTSTNNNVERKFRQSFILAKQRPNEYFVLNDILQFSNSSELTTTYVFNDDDKLTEAATSVPNAVLSTAADNNASDTEEAVKRPEDIKEADDPFFSFVLVDPSVQKDVYAKVGVSTASSPPREKVYPIVIPASDSKVEAPKSTFAPVVSKIKYLRDVCNSLFM